MAIRPSVVTTNHLNNNNNSIVNYFVSNNNNVSNNEKLSFVDWFREMCSYQFVVLLIGCRTLRIS
ncbi:hypothetical protein Syun_020742 [Stephania yunnanensis]|uniref:Uncharacterized protein n=1 Tax=Stephania yunnanensis TaxID=152371 RepID=A0AAP0IES3_9MAGN